jgi:hypothetical protein
MTIGPVPAAAGLRNLAHKRREAMGSEVHNPDQPEPSGAVEVDGMYVI